MTQRRVYQCAVIARLLLMATLAMMGLLYGPQWLTPYLGIAIFVAATTEHHTKKEGEKSYERRS